MSMIVRDWLSNYIPLMIEVMDQLERVARMRSAEITPPKTDNIGGGNANGATNKLERAILNRLAYQDKITPALEESIAELESIRTAIDSLRDPMFRTVLRLRYIDAVDGKRREWSDIALRIYGKDEERHIRAARRIHDKAVDAICLILEK